MRSRLLTVTMGISILSITAACHKTVPVASTPAVPAALRPTSAAAAQSRRAPSVTPAAPAKTATAASAASSKQIEDLLNKLLDAYFDYNDARLRNDAISALSADSQTLRSLLPRSPDTKYVVAGNCDERGSAEYNLALGDRRAHSAREFLIQAGVPSERLTTISYGKERPICVEHNEECWRKNRRAHLSEAR